MKIELHCHTRYSHDSLLCLFVLYRRCIRKEIQYIAVTEHNNLRGAIAFRAYCARRGDRVHVIPGEEIMTTEGEIIGLYLKEEIEKGLTPEETISRIRAQGGVVYVPHPYDEKRWKTVLREDALQRLHDQVDCIECYNGRNISPEYGTRQTEIADRYGLPKVVGSDAHTAMEIGRNTMEVTVAPKNQALFMEAIRTGISHTMPCLTAAHQITKAARVVHLVLEGRWHDLYRILFRRNRGEVKRMGE